MARYILTTAVLVVPVVFDPRTNDAFNLTKMTTLWVLVVLAAGAWWFSSRLSRSGPFFPRSRIVVAALAVLGVTALSTLMGPNRTLSFHGLYHRYEGLASIALYVGLLILLVALYRRRPGSFSQIAVAIGAAGGVVGTYVVFQRLGLDPFNWQELGGGEPTFPIGNLGNSSFTAAYLGITAPFVLYLFLSSKLRGTRVVWAGVGGIVLAGLLLTQGRAGILAALAGCVALLLFTSRMNAVRKMALVAAALLVLAVMPFVIGDPTDRSEEGLFRAGTASYRTEVWGASWRMSMSRPLLGWGPESYFGQYGTFRSPSDARRLGLSLTDKPHNIFLGWSTATGLIGLGTYLFLVGSALMLVAGAATRNPARRRLIAVFGAGLVAYLVQGMYSIDVPSLAMMGWVALAGIAVLVDRRGGEQEADEDGDVDEASDAPPDPSSAETEQSRPRSWFAQPWVSGATVVVVALVAIGVGVGPLRADYAIRTAQQRAPQGWSSDVMALYEKAIGLDPREAAYRGLAGAYLETVADDSAAPFTSATALRRSAAFYEDAVGLQPRNVYFMINAARVYTQLGAGDERFFSDADGWLGEVVTLDPLNPQAHDLYADLLHQWSEEAEDEDEVAELRERSQTQAEIARGLRAGRVIR
ncbi:MAG: O-antigen ligase family protein [Actinomycetota bacterium]